MRSSFLTRDWTRASALEAQILSHWTTREAWEVFLNVASSWTKLNLFPSLSVPFIDVYEIFLCAKSLQSRPTLCDPMNWSPLGSSVHGISQGRILEWVTSSSSRGFSQNRDQTHVSYLSRWILYHCATWEAPRCQLFSKVVVPSYPFTSKAWVLVTLYFYNTVFGFSIFIILLGV